MQPKSKSSAKNIINKMQLNHPESRNEKTYFFQKAIWTVGGA